MNELLERVRAVATAAVTWLTVAAFVVQALIDELGDDLPTLVEPAARVVAVLGGLVLVIRRVTPVGADQRGLT